MLKFRPLYLFKLNFIILLSVFCPGLSITHDGTVVVNPNARICMNSRLHVGASIGASRWNDDNPTIENNVYIDPEAFLSGGIEIANNISIGVNSTVNKIFADSNSLIACIPTTLIKSAKRHGLRDQV